MNRQSDKFCSSRREFLAKSALGGAALVGGLSLARSAHAAGSEVVRIGLVGCGGRGTGAAVNALKNAAKANVKLVAMADAFSDRLESSLRNIQAELQGPPMVDVPPERQFVGLDAYQKAARCRRGHGAVVRPAGLPPRAVRGRRQGRQARLHGEAGGHRRPRHPPHPGRQRRGQEEEPAWWPWAITSATRTSTAKWSSGSTTGPSAN